MLADLDAYRCCKCHSVFVDTHAVRKNDGTVRCPECKNIVDYVKCCKTCANWRLGGCMYFEVGAAGAQSFEVGSGGKRSGFEDPVNTKIADAIGGLFNFEKGPPWLDCRGWKVRT